MSVRNSIMNLVLYFFEELNRNFCLGVVVDAGGVDFQNLTVKHLFGSADVPDALQQFFEISTAAQIFQPFIVQCKACAHIFLQEPSRPDAKLCAAFGFDPVADRDNDIEVVIVHIVDFSICGSVGKFCPHLFLLKLTFLEDVPDVFSNDTPIALEQLGHLVDGQPDGIAIKRGINFGQAIFSGINDDGIFEAFIRAIHFRTSFKSCVKPEKLYKTPK